MQMQINFFVVHLLPFNFILIPLIHLFCRARQRDIY